MLIYYGDLQKHLATAINTLQ